MIRIIATTLLLALFIQLNAQNNIASPGPKGIFVYLGTRVPNGVKVNSIKIERKEDKGGYQALTEVRAPATEGDFIAKAKAGAIYFPDFTFPADSTLRTLWARAARYGLADSLGYWGMHPAVRLALGMMYYDLSAKQNVVYQYKLILTGTTSEERTSDAALYPYHPAYDAIALDMYSYDKKGLYVRWKSVGKNPAEAFKVYCYPDSKSPVEVKETHDMYRVKDTTFYFLFDKTAVTGKTYQYSVVGVDKFANTSYGSQPAVINLVDFSLVHFKYTKADMTKDNLGLRLSWQLSTTENVASIHIFRSTDFLKDFKEIAVARITDTVYIDSKISPNKIYYYYLQIKDKSATQTKNSATFFQFGFDNHPPLPPHISAAVPVKNGVRLQVEVTDVNVEGIRVLRSENGSSDFTTINSLVPLVKDSARIIYYDTAGLNAKTFYNYVVQSENSSHLLSEKSNKVQVRPDMPTEPIAPPVFTVYYQDSAINLFWSDMKKDDWTIAGYQLFKKGEGDKEFKPVFPNDSVYAGTRYTDYEYSSGKNYEYEVLTVDLFGYKSKTRTVGAATVPVVQVAQPAGLKGINLPDGVRLEWSQNIQPDVKGYKLYRYQRGQNPVLVGSPTVSTTDYLDKSAKGGQLYFYYLTAINTAGLESAPSDEIGVKH